MIREATIQDLASLNHLLFQVNNVHADGRPDLFQHGSKNIQMNNLSKSYKMIQDQSLFMKIIFIKYLDTSFV